jgi:hypothetical protein
VPCHIMFTSADLNTDYPLYTSHDARTQPMLSWACVRTATRLTCWLILCILIKQAVQPLQSPKFRDIFLMRSSVWTRLIATHTACSVVVSDLMRSSSAFCNHHHSKAPGGSSNASLPEVFFSVWPAGVHRHARMQLYVATTYHRLWSYLQ